MGFLDQYSPTPSWGIFCSPKKKYQGGERGEGCVGALGIDWAITEIDSKAIKNQVISGGGIVEGQ